MKRIAIIGGGPSGLITSIYAKTKENTVVIFEKNSAPLKKLLLTGNGKCNLWNMDQSSIHYHSYHEKNLGMWITDENQKEVLSFFQRIGLVLKIKNGYCYPNSNQAISVKNALIEEALKKGVIIKNNSNVLSLTKKKDIFLIQTEKDVFTFDFVVLATGSFSYPNTGSTGDGYKFSKFFGHQIEKVLPSLVPLELENKMDAEGVRTDVKVSIWDQDQLIKEEVGELQITNYGVSGICIFNLSRYASLGLEQGKKMILKINFLPFLKENAYSWFCHHCEKLKDKTICQILDGILNYKLGNAILKMSKIEKEAKWQDLSDLNKKVLVKNLTELSCKIKSTKDFNNAQVSLGGVSLEEVTENLESKFVSHLYFVGELLDVDGDCGGYNLGFAWMSGIIVGSHIFKEEVSNKG